MSLSPKHTTPFSVTDILSPSKRPTRRLRSKRLFLLWWAPTEVQVNTSQQPQQWAAWVAWEACQPTLTTTMYHSCRTILRRSRASTVMEGTCPTTVTQCPPDTALRPGTAPTLRIHVLQVSWTTNTFSYSHPFSITVFFSEYSLYFSFIPVDLISYSLYTILRVYNAISKSS